MNKTIRKIITFALLFVLIFTTGCGGSGEKESAQPLADVTAIPDDGIITKEQFKTVAGAEKKVQFTSETDTGISYTWEYSVAQIKNPADQNLKVDFTSEGLDDIKKQANDAVNALKMTMYGNELIAVPTLTVILPEVWDANTGVLLKEQGGNLARMSDVTIEVDEEASTTTLTMKVTALNGDCFVVGGVTAVQNKGAENANKGNEANALDNNASENNSNEGDTNETGTDDNENENTENNDNNEDANVLTCTVTINCSTILNNMDKLPKEKREFVPADGLILAPVEVEFEKGDSAHDILKRVCQAAEIHMESTYTPVYDSAYIEGINQLYEFDCGELSGWMFQVNGWFPNYGPANYKVEDGDVINWVYTCDLGEDVGGSAGR